MLRSRERSGFIRAAILHHLSDISISRQDILMHKWDMKLTTTSLPIIWRKTLETIGLAAAVETKF